MTPPPTCLGFNGDDRDLPYGGSQVSRGGVGGLGGTFESHIPGRYLQPRVAESFRRRSVHLVLGE